MAGLVQAAPNQIPVQSTSALPNPITEVLYGICVKNGLHLSSDLSLPSWSISLMKPGGSGEPPIGRPSLVGSLC
jgi:hypothetical protein